MKAAVIHEHGGPEQVRVEDIPEPRCGDDEVVIKVRAAGLNHLDIWVRNGRPGPELPKPHVLGSDASGVVCAVGAKVKGVSVGDEVIINPGLSCGKCERCRSGEQSECVSFGIVGLVRPGTFAEMVAVPARNVLLKPAHMSFSEAGAFVLTFLTAWRMLMTRAQLKSGQTVLIHGIGGGVAVCALQLARLAGAKVIVTSSNDSKLERARQLGADYAINYKTGGDVARQALDFTSGSGVDVIIDTVGGATWPVNFAAARRGGKIVLCGVTGGPEAVTNLRALYWNQLSILGSTMGSDDDFHKMVEAVTNAKLTPVIDSVWPLDDVSGAMAKMEAGGQFGKIALDVSH